VDPKTTDFSLLQSSFGGNVGSTMIHRHQRQKYDRGLLVIKLPFLDAIGIGLARVMEDGLFIARSMGAS
jgi:hypothetical protein